MMFKKNGKILQRSTKQCRKGVVDSEGFSACENLGADGTVSRVSVVKGSSGLIIP